MGKCYQMYLDNTGDDPTVVIGQVKKNIVLVNLYTPNASALNTSYIFFVCCADAVRPIETQHS